MKRRAVFLDRDGTLNTECDFCRRPEDLTLLPGVGKALGALRGGGFALVVVTNQSGVARGYLDETTLARIHDRLQAQLVVPIDAFLHCPHHPLAGTSSYTRTCACRKPAPGLLDRAIGLLDLEPHGSWVVGDSARDLLAARHLPLGRILVRSGKPAERELSALTREGCPPDQVVDDLGAAASHILLMQ